ncbi:MAG: CZB domain-containing protein [Paracoccaceae bacterium]|jgi:hypothetical protein
MTQTLEEALHHAIGQHFAWQLHLKSSVESGQAPMPHDTARAHDCCEFGQWLAQPEQIAQRGETVQYRVIDRLHRAFHEAAGRVVEALENGRREEAHFLLETEFEPQSQHLAAGLSKWLREAHHGTAL